MYNVELDDDPERWPPGVLGDSYPQFQAHSLGGDTYPYDPQEGSVSYHDSVPWPGHREVDYETLIALMDNTTIFGTRVREEHAASARAIPSQFLMGTHGSQHPITVNIGGTQVVSHFLVGAPATSPLSYTVYILNPHLAAHHSNLSSIITNYFGDSRQDIPSPYLTLQSHTDLDISANSSVIPPADLAQLPPNAGELPMQPSVPVTTAGQTVASSTVGAPTLLPCLYDHNGSPCHESIANNRRDAARHLRARHNVRRGHARLRCLWQGCTMTGDIRGDSLSRHVVSRHMDASVCCAMCSKTFSRIDSLQAHTKKGMPCEGAMDSDVKRWGSPF